MVGRYEADIRTGLLRMLITSSSQFVEQCPRLFEVLCAEAFGKPAVDGSEEVASFGRAALVAAQLCDACGRAQFPKLVLLLLSDAQGFAIQFLGGLRLPLPQ